MTIYKDSRYNSGWNVKLVFSIHLHVKDVKILYVIQNFFGLGNISINKDTANYQVTSLKHILSIIEHFNKYPLRTQKQIDFLLFTQAYNLIVNKSHLIGLQDLVNIRASMNKGIPERLALEFPKTKSVAIPEFISIQDKLFDMNYWISGFVTGEGCFFVKTSKSKTHKLHLSVGLNFIVVQNVRDLTIMEKIKSIFGCGSLTVNESSEIVRYTVSKLSDIENKIIPFLDRYPIIGEKVKDYEDFKKVFDLMINKSHLTKKGLDEILTIKSKMNFNRK